MKFLFSLFGGFFIGFAMASLRHDQFTLAGAFLIGGIWCLIYSATTRSPQ